MTQTTTEQSREAYPAEDIPLHLSDILLNLIVALLAPMFLGAGGGNLAFARMAAIETVNAYRIRNQADLISVAQIIAFGLAALGSLSLSMVDDLSVSMTLRLRGNANACNRSAEQNRRALAAGARDAQFNSTPTIRADPDAAAREAAREAAVIASVATAQQLVADAQARVRDPVAAPAPIAPETVAAPAPAPSASKTVAATISERQNQAMWAAGMVRVAAGFTADLPNLPPLERREATLRAAALSSCAHDLLSGAPLPPRLRPGNLAAMMRPNAR